MTNSFLDRWSRRKADAREGKPLPEPPAPVPVAAEPLPAPDAGAPAAGLAAVQPVAPAPPPLSLEDVKTLTPESNFTPFMGSGVAPEVRNAAMRKLFADPHFNVMDRLDTYIDDYSQPDPIPESMLRQMAGARFLVSGDKDEAVRDDADDPTAQSVAQFGETAEQPAAVEEDPSQSAPAQTLASEPAQKVSHADHVHTHLRLQPDDAAGAEDPRRGAP